MMTKVCRASKTGFYMSIPGPSQSATNLYLVRCVMSTIVSFELVTQLRLDMQSLRLN